MVRTWSIPSAHRTYTATGAVSKQVAVASQQTEEQAIAAADATFPAWRAIKIKRPEAKATGLFVCIAFCKRCETP